MKEGGEGNMGFFEMVLLVIAAIAVAKLLQFLFS